MQLRFIISCNTIHRMAPVDAMCAYRHAECAMVCVGGLHAIVAVVHGGGSCWDGGITRWSRQQIHRASVDTARGEAEANPLGATATTACGRRRGGHPVVRQTGAYLRMQVGSCVGCRLDSASQRPCGASPNLI